MPRNPWSKAAAGGDRRQRSFPSERPLTAAARVRIPCAPYLVRGSVVWAQPCEPNANKSARAARLVSIPTVPTSDLARPDDGGTIRWWPGDRETEGSAMFEIAWKGGQHAALAESLALQAANGIEATRLTLLIVTHGAPARVPWVVDP